MIHIQFTVPNAAELLAPAVFGTGAVLRWGSGATVDGAFTEGGTVALVAGTSIYDVWDPAGLAGTWYRYRISNVGATVFGDYSLPVEGGTIVDYASLLDVQSRRGGDDPIVSDKWDGVITDKIREISRDLDRMVARARGCSGEFRIVASPTASSRTFYAPEGGAEMLPIDDCVSITSVARRLSPTVAPAAIEPGTDYRLVRSRGVIVALASLTGGWTTGQSADVLACWGLMDAVSPDLREVTVIEVIRSFMGDRVGNNDTLGLTPFGQMTFAKAFTSKVSKFVADWTYGGASLRGH